MNKVKIYIFGALITIILLCGLVLIENHNRESNLVKSIAKGKILNCENYTQGGRYTVDKEFYGITLDNSDIYFRWHPDQSDLALVIDACGNNKMVKIWFNSHQAVLSTKVKHWITGIVVVET
jgi:hypothetical protein